jgi:HEAT repeat protein
MVDLESRLDAVRDMQIDMDVMPPMPPMDFHIDPIDMDLNFDLAPHVFDLAPMDMDLDIHMPDMPDLPDMIEMPDMPDTPYMPDVPVPAMVPMTPMAPMIAMPAVPPMPADLAFSLDALRGPGAIARVQGMSPFERQFSGISTSPPQPWAQSDPADSLYRLAREALNRGEYRRAAQLFSDITQKFPSSVYASDARYYRAFALYRLGGTSDLRDALNTLQAGGTYRQASLQTDAPVLATRIRGALAAQGDGAAIKAVNATAAQSDATCDREDLAVRVEALNSLGQTDPESTTPILRRLLARRDDCSGGLRRAALYLLGRRTDADAMNMVIGAARNDPDIRVRAEALRFLAAMPGDQPAATIEEMARTPGNEELQRSAIAALGRSDSPRARQSLRAIVEKTDLNENLRMAALSSIDTDRSPENGAYLRGVYPRLETARLKAAAIRSVARSGGNDNDQWLLSIVRNQSEPVEVRALALRYAGRSGLSIGDLTKMYDVAGDRPLREQLINLYAQRNEPEATDKLMEIARTGTDPDLRRYAISALSRKNDPRTKKLLLEIIDR